MEAIGSHSPPRGTGRTTRWLVSELAYCGTDVEVSDVYGPWDGGWGFGMMLVMLLFLALIVVGIVFVVRSFSDGGRMTPRSGNRALDILDERFARGELDREEYEERRRTLTEGR